ncbi:MAG: thiamine phosphate synthase [Peptostreptococcaceae bacterium]
MEYLKVYLVTDSQILEEKDFYKSIEDALRAGIKVVQLREKDASGKEFLEKAYKLRLLTKKYNAYLIINDRVDIAQIVDADGVHVGQSDINANEVRKLIGKDKILGVSVGSVKEAKHAKAYGADYIGVGTMFNTSTKLDAKLVSIDVLNDIKKQVDIPIVLIGGINLDNIITLKHIKPDGYAVVSAILGSENIYEESKRWIKLVDSFN